MTDQTHVLASRLPAFKHRNFRRYAAGQLASVGGSWLQTVALSWLVLELTESGTAVGIIGSAQFLPALLLGAWAGTVADRFDGQRSVLALQVFLGLQAVVLAVLVLTDSAEMWSLVLLSLWHGVGRAFDAPIRQSIMNDLVGDAELPNAIATNSALVQLGLIIGPALAAVLIRTVGIGWCFAVNAASYVVMYVAISSIRSEELFHRPKASGADASVRAGFAHLRHRRDVAVILLVVALASLLAMRLEVLLPILAKDLGGGSGLYAAMTIVRGIGALFAALFFASRVGPASVALLRSASVLSGVSLALLAVPNRAVVLIVLFPAGVGVLGVIVMTLSMTQLLASPQFRGRFVAVWFVVINGGVVAGSVLSGALAEFAGTSAALLAAAATMGVVAIIVSRYGGLVQFEDSHGE